MPMAKTLKPMHPGEVLREEFLVSLSLSAGALARTCNLPRTRIERIANEQTGITADTALRLAKALGTTAQLWLNLQNEIAKRRLSGILDKIKVVNKPRRRDRVRLRSAPHLLANIETSKRQEALACARASATDGAVAGYPPQPYLD